MSKVPLRIATGELESARFYIPVSFNGRTQEFQLDTGSTYTLIAHDDFTAKFPVISSMERKSIANKPVLDQIVQLKQFKLGSLERASFSAVRPALGSQEENRLGLSGLSDDQTTFDFRENTVEFEVPAPAGAALFPLRIYPRGLFGFTGEIAGNHVNMLWDTGAGLSVVDRELVKETPAGFHFLQKENGVDPMGNSVTAELYLAHDIRFGDTTLAGLVLAMDFEMMRQSIDPSLRLIVGTNIMRGRRWYFDLEQKLWSFD